MSSLKTKQSRWSIRTAKAMTASVDTRQASVFRVRLSAVEVRLNLSADVALTPFFSSAVGGRIIAGGICNEQNIR